MRGLMLAGLMIGVAGCSVLPSVGSRGAEPQAPLPYEARLTKGEDRRNFTVRVADKGVGLDRARESARYPATGYCLLGFGSSRIDWQMNAAGTDWATRRGDRGRLVVSGRCVGR